MVDVTTPSIMTNWNRKGREVVFGKLVPDSKNWPHLSVQSQQNKHDEETDGPKLGQRHHGDGLGVRDEGQARTWGTATECVLIHIEL